MHDVDILTWLSEMERNYRESGDTYNRLMMIRVIDSITEKTREILDLTERLEDAERRAEAVKDDPPLEPVRIPAAFSNPGGRWRWGCPRCRKELGYKWKYCPECGKSVKWL